jgi:hypothetical protein
MVRIAGVRAQSGGASSAGASSSNAAQPGKAAQPGITAASSPDGQQSLGDLVAVAAKDVSQLIRYEIDLAKRELRADVKRAAITGALFGFAAFVGCLVLVLLTFALALGLNAAGVPGGGGLYVCFVYAAVILVLVAGTLAGVAILVMKRFSGMKQTRKTVTDDLSMLRRRDGAAAGTAPGGALLDGHAAGALPADGAKATAEILDDRS